MEYVVNMNLIYIFGCTGEKHYPHTIREEYFLDFLWNIRRLGTGTLIGFPPPPPKKQRG